MTPYEEYREKAKQYVADNRSAIDETIQMASQSIFPQHILWMKEVCDELKTEEAKTALIEGKFYFTEQLVNRLMLYAFLKGEKRSNSISYKKGWSDCRKDIANKLDFIEDEDSEC